MTLLSNLTIRNAKPELKAYTLKDGNGLFLRIEPNGTKVWHFRFYWKDKQKLISFGTYPKVDIKTAREKREEARALLAKIKTHVRRKNNKPNMALIKICSPLPNLPNIGKNSNSKN